MPAAEGDDRSWVALAAIGAGGLALLGLAVMLLRGSGRRRRNLALPDVSPPLPSSPPAPLAVPPAPAPPSPARSAGEASPRLEIEFTPRRAGTNVTSAAIDYQIRVRNTGDVAARDIVLGIYMLSASARQAADLQSILGMPVDQAAAAPFALAPGGAADLSGMALLPRDDVNIMTIDGKPWFVPVLAIRADYRWGDNVGAPGMATAAYMIGIDRGEGAKMAPFRLDTGPHMHPSVSARRVA